MRALVNLGLTPEADSLVNVLLPAAARCKPVIEWGLQQGMHVTGTKTPFQYLQEIQRYSTAGISAQVKQDVLLLAGAEDHYVPHSMFYRQIETLTHVRSLTARLFTRAEHAQNHCQLGNVSLALRVIVDWLEMQLDLGRNADSDGASDAHPSG
jgi:predicted DNA-binding ribbon-helix-helix protein